MATDNKKLAVIIKNPSNEEEFLLIKQIPPPQFNDPEYDSQVDSDLWDLPSTDLHGTPIKSDLSASSDMPDLKEFDLRPALNQLLDQVGFGKAKVNWELLRSIKEPDFGPGLPIDTLYLVGYIDSPDGEMRENCKWLTVESCHAMLHDVKPGDDRIGPLVVLGLMNKFTPSDNWKVPPTLRVQEYPPGVKLVPMQSRTAKPFHTTNLVIFVSGANSNNCTDNSFAAQGDALIVDPGCSSSSHKELEEIVAALPKKLVVFVTHHHNDHIDGLSTVQKSNGDAIMLGHENTLRRIGKDYWSLGCVSVRGNEEICIGGQRLRIIPAPGHTDGHMALLHVSSNSLIVGDHCVGQGSALLDAASGGNMGDYYQTTYLFKDLSPHNLIPMHGRTNMWPKHMLSWYLKNRRERESTILKAIEDGAKTLFDIVSVTYAEVDRSLWIPASWNVRLHVDHLAEQDKLPKKFSIQQFQRSCRLQFLTRWLWVYVRGKFPRKQHALSIAEILGAVAVVSSVAMYFFWRNPKHV